MSVQNLIITPTFSTNLLWLETITLLLLLLTGTIFSYFCMSSITSVLILAILMIFIVIDDIPFSIAGTKFSGYYQIANIR